MPFLPFIFNLLELIFDMRSSIVHFLVSRGCLYSAIDISCSMNECIMLLVREMKWSENILNFRKHIFKY